MSALSLSQQEGLQQVVGLMETHGLTPADVQSAVKARKRQKKQKAEKQLSRHELLLRLFTYIGGTLIFAGLGVFTETIWGDLNSLARVVITFGVGFTAYLLGLIFASDKRFDKAATPAHIIAFILQPTGLFVLLNEYFQGGDAALGALVVFGLLTVQQGLTFVKYRRPSILLFTLLYAIGFHCSATEYLDINRGISALTIGVFLMFIGVDLQRRLNFKDLTPFIFIIGTSFFYCGLFYFIGRTVFDTVALSFILSMLFYSVVRDNKTLYVLSVLYMAGYYLCGPGGGWHYGWHTHNQFTEIVTGTSLLLTGHWMRNSNNISLFPVWMFAGMGCALAGAYGLLDDTAFEFFYIAIAAAGIYASLILRSRSALAASVISLIGFISEFSAKHFAHTLGWPLVLIFIGILILVAGFGFARLSGRIKAATI